MIAQYTAPRALPAGLEVLAEIAADLRWTWSHAGDALWKMLDPHAWMATKNPYVVLQNLSQQRLEALARDEKFIEQLERLTAARDGYLHRSSWYGDTYAAAPLKGVAYFSMEFGLGEALPLYAGGLGILAGDYLKAVSDLGVPLTAVGLLYQEGYFRQTFDEHGWQQAVYPYNDPTSLPIRPVASASGAWLHVEAELPGRTVRFRVWQAQVGRVPLYLLDSNDPLNSPSDRGITGKLYGGGHELRLVQEIALGLCGWRLIEALGLEVDICHLNEGHAAFVTLERARSFMQRHQTDFWQALWATRPGNIFTTHTPVAAGFDSFDRDLLLKYGQHYAQQLGVDAGELAALGRVDGNQHGAPFNMAYLALRTCGAANGVSRLHGAVSRRIFAPLYPRWPEAEVPVSHVTNGIHAPSWDSPWADEIWTDVGGKGRWLGDVEGLTEAIAAIDDERLWSFLGQERADLVNYARSRLARQMAQRCADGVMVCDVETVLDPNVLTIGFARRFAEYKRPHLLLQDQARLIRLLSNSERPVQIIVAGKAHPEDNIGKRFIQQWIEFVQRPEARSRAVFLEDYDIALAQELVQGVDLWINNPRRPWEACGTSGMKVLVNGGLNLSELDGWWAEAYTPEVGWAIGNGEEHHDGEWDRREAEQIFEILENEVVPAFYERDNRGIPPRWVAKVRASMSRLAPQFSCNRMVRDYVQQFYLPAAQRHAQRQSSGAELTAWEHSLRSHWQQLHWGKLEVQQGAEGWRVAVQVILGAVDPQSVRVQIFADGMAGSDADCFDLQQGEAIPGAINGYNYHAQPATERPARDFTLRIIPTHPLVQITMECGLIMWGPGLG
jgi:starch phosphorylase